MPGIKITKLIIKTTFVCLDLFRTKYPISHNAAYGDDTNVNKSKKFDSVCRVPPKIFSTTRHSSPDVKPAKANTVVFLLFGT